MASRSKWARVVATQSTGELASYGPCFLVSLRPVAPDGVLQPTLESLVALIDTGASASCMSLRVAH